MTAKEFQTKLEIMRNSIGNLRKEHFPIKAGRIAKTHFQDNFNKGGFVNGGLKKWKPSQRIGRSESAKDNYPTLRSSKNHLFSSINYEPGEGRVLIYNRVPYATIHNHGGVINQNFTPTAKQRKFAWAIFFKETGIKKGMSKEEKQKLNNAASQEAKNWKGLALAKKIKRTINIPQRQFIGQSTELNKKVRDMLDQEMSKIINDFLN